MTPGQILFRSRFGVDESKASFRRDAEATRAGNATNESWKKVFGKRDDQ